jgi:CAAX prenyl protease-like protein
LPRHPALPWVLPFAIFIALLAAQSAIPAPVWLRLVLPMAAIVFYSRPALCCGPTSPALSVLLGLAVFALWVGPDIVAPAWRHTFLFDNFLIHPLPATPPADRSDSLFIFWRVAVLTISVPILEELFWRGWLMRWLINPDFEKIALGTYAPMAFWVVAALFASEHGPFWDVGLITGVIFNWWMIRTKNMWDCIVTHAVTNFALGVYVVMSGHWEYL